MNIQELVISRLVKQHGWFTDHLVPNWVGKHYKTAVAPTARASLRLSHDKVNHQFWLNGEFTSAGENVLATAFACLPEAFDEAEVHAAVDEYIADAEKRIAGAYSVRLLRFA